MTSSLFPAMRASSATKATRLAAYLFSSFRPHQPAISFGFSLSRNERTSRVTGVQGTLSGADGLIAFCRVKMLKRMKRWVMRQCGVPKLNRKERKAGAVARTVAGRRFPHPFSGVPFVCCSLMSSYWAELHLIYHFPFLYILQQ